MSKVREEGVEIVAVFSILHCWMLIKKKNFSLNQSYIYAAAEATDASLSFSPHSCSSSSLILIAGLSVRAHTDPDTLVCVHAFDAVLLWSVTHRVRVPICRHINLWYPSKPRVLHFICSTFSCIPTWEWECGVVSYLNLSQRAAACYCYIIWFIVGAGGVLGPELVGSTYQLGLLYRTVGFFSIFFSQNTVVCWKRCWIGVQQRHTRL